MSHSTDRYQFHKHSYSAENEATVNLPSFGVPRPVRQTRAGTDPGKLPHHNVGIHDSSTPRTIPEWYKACSHIRDYSTLLSKNNPTAETVTKQEREGLLLSKLSTLNHSRHGSARESAVTSSPEEMTSSQTFRTTKPGIGQMPSSNLDATVSTEEMLEGIGELSSLVAALHIQDGNADNECSELISSRTTSLADVEARVDSFLNTLEQWTTQTGDASVLQSLLRDISILSSGRATAPAQLGAQDLPGGPTSEAFRSEQQPCSNPGTPDAAGRNGEGKRAREEATNQDRPETKLAHRGSRKCGKLRCPLYFGGEGQRCETLHKFNRDLIRHLKRHALFFCTKCFLKFSTSDGVDSHSCDQICRHRGCSREGSQIYEHQVGCAFFSDGRNTQLKWYTLFKQIFPNAEPPNWGNVYVYVNEMSALTSPDAGTLEHTQPTLLEQSTTLVPHTFSTTVPAESSLVTTSAAADAGNSYSTDQQRIREMMHELREQYMAIIHDSWQQSESRMANETTITRQRQELQQLRGQLNELRVNKVEQSATIANLQGQVERNIRTNASLQNQVEQTKAMNSNLQGQVRDMRAEVMQLRSLLMPLVRSRLQQDQNVQELPMEIDFLGANYGAWSLGNTQ